MAGGPLGALLVASHLLAPRPTRLLTLPIERLVQQLAGEAGTSYDARAELIRIGSEAIIDGLPSLDAFGRLTAIEVFEEVGDPRCGPALIRLLDSDNPTVREWAAIVLASLEIDGAVEPLRRAYRACLERQTPPDWTEPAGIRWALTELGARSPVVPPLTAHLRTTAADDAPGWPSARFTGIINDLADHAQVILYSQFWQVHAGHTYDVDGPRLDWELNWTAPLGAPGRRGPRVVPAGGWRSPRRRRHLRRPCLDRPHRPAPGEVTPCSSSTPRRLAPAM
ncbi:HEAT repeat domain-containing protein [Streptomyces sp. P9-A2]|uniref:HEAT repeat domain-containing protein n=1 Tax=Streptomyces sp. P9-A2 TaxID=3072284 RepID=UPI002FC6B1B9